MPTPKVLFLLADGARARFVERSPETGYFVTVQEIDSRHRLRQLRDELRASPPARTLEQGYPGRHSLAQQDFFRTAKEAFATEVAEKAASMVQKRQYQGVFLAAPARLNPAQERELDLRGACARRYTPNARCRRGAHAPSMWRSVCRPVCWPVCCVRLGSCVLLVDATVACLRCSHSSACWCIVACGAPRPAVHAAHCAAPRCTALPEHSLTHAHWWVVRRPEDLGLLPVRRHPR